MNPRKFLGMVEMKRILYSCKDGDLAKITGVSERTYKRRKQNPEQFTIEEMNHLIKFLKFTEEERKEALL